MMELVQVIFLLLQFHGVPVQRLSLCCLGLKFPLQSFGCQPGFFRHGLDLLVQSRQIGLFFFLFLLNQPDFLFQPLMILLKSRQLFLIQLTFIDQSIHLLHTDEDPVPDAPFLCFQLFIPLALLLLPFLQGLTFRLPLIDLNGGF